MMRYLALLFLSLVLFSTFSGGGKTPLAQTKSEWASVSSLQDSSAHDDCDDHSNPCKECHLGHCSFTVASVARLFVPQSFTLIVPAEVTHTQFVSLPGLPEPPSAV